MRTFPVPASPDRHCPLLAIDVMTSADRTRSALRLRGELDMSNVEELHLLLDQLRSEGHRTVVLDLAELRFLSCAGLTVLVEAHRSLHCIGGQLVLCDPAPPVRHVLKLTGMDAVLTIQDCLPTLDPTAQQLGGDGHRPAPTSRNGRARMAGSVEPERCTDDVA